MSNDSHVMTCLATDCSYNENEGCNAGAVEIGDEHPMCDTYTTQPVQQKSSDDSSVGRCMVDECHFNSNMACNASGITLLRHAGHADCATYRM